MQQLTGVIQHYAWGHRSAISDLLGTEPTGEPEAELWLGAHPKAPSTLDDGRSLADVAPDLPFLLKILAAAKPLSIQAHPSLEQARAGFARENAAGIALDAPDRTYRDANHKPEMICALTPFEALCGLRALEQTRELFEALGPGVEPMVERLAAPGSDATVLADTLAWTLRDASPRDVERCIEACRSLDRPGWATEAQTVLDAATHFGTDPGVIVTLLLNRVTLQPGEALYLGAGNLHAYLSGVGVEVMANSDNVVRGGLTSKNVDVPELLDVVDCTPIEPDIQRPDDWNHRYRSDAPEFALHRYEIGGGRSVAWQRSAPAIAIVTRGAVESGGETIARGQAVYLAPDDEVTFTGEAQLHLATTN